MPAMPEWHGTPSEWDALTSALGKHCTCEFADSILMKSCDVHLMLADQDKLDSLLFGKRIAERIRAEEFTVKTDAL